jgi:hypothetical protein
VSLGTPSTTDPFSTPDWRRANTCAQPSATNSQKSMTQMIKRAPPLISQQLRGIVEAKRSQSLYNDSCDRSALMMPRTCCGIKGGACVTHCVITPRKPLPDSKK